MGMRAGGTKEELKEIRENLSSSNSQRQAVIKGKMNNIRNRLADISIERGDLLWDYRLLNIELGRLEKYAAKP